MTALDDIIAGRRPRPVVKSGPVITALTVTPNTTYPSNQYGDTFSNPNQAVEQAMSQEGMGPTQPFAPGRPINPYRHLGTAPRQYDLITGANITVRPRSNRIPFQMLRQFTETWDVAAMCIAHRINSFRSFEWQIVPSEGAEGDVTASVTRAKHIMAKPDGVTPHPRWMATLLLDLFRYDAPALYKQRDLSGRVMSSVDVDDRGNKGGLFVVDGSTIAPLIDYDGRQPSGEAPAFIQYANGVPWVWLLASDLIYEPFYPRSDSPYGKAPIEDVWLAANTDMRMAIHLMDYYAAGNIPGGFFKTDPQTFSDPDKVTEAQDVWDAANEADQERKVQARFLPAGVTDFIEAAKQPFDEAAYLWLVRKGCAAFGVVPQDIGLTMDVNRANGETQMDIQERTSDRPLAKHIDGIITRYLQDDLGLQVDYVTSYSAEKEDRVEEAQVWAIAIEHAAASPDEMRSEMLGLEVDNERPVPRGFNTTRAGMVPLANYYAVAGPVDPKTAAPLESLPISDVPIEGAAGTLPGKTLNTPGALVSGFSPDEPGFPGQEVIPQPAPHTLAPTEQKAAATSVVAKAETTGVTSDTGITGVDLKGHKNDDDDDYDDTATEGENTIVAEKVTKELRQWKENARNRLKAGKPQRRFVASSIPSLTQHRVWKSLETATTREEVDAAFEVAKGTNPKVLTPTGRS